MSALAALLALALVAASGPDIGLTAQKPLSRSVDAYPRITAPATEATAKINAELVKNDARVKNAARDCNQTESFNGGQWGRVVAAPYRYGDLLTLSATDEWSCPTYGGSFFTAVTYDLTTGEQVDWASLMPPRIAGDPAPGAAGDTTKLALRASPILNEIYRRKALIAMGPDERVACADAFQSQYFMMLWVDAEQEGVGMRGVGMPTRFANCSQSALLTIDELGQIKAGSRLIDGLKAAHAAHAWSNDLRPGGSRTRQAVDK